MRRWTGIVLMTLCAAAVPQVLAAQDAPAGQRPMQGPGGPGRGRGPGGIERLLQLTDEQQKAVKALRDEEREAMRPLVEQMAPLQRTLREALDAPSPDALTVGQHMLDVRAV